MEEKPLFSAASTLSTRTRSRQVRRNKNENFSAEEAERRRVRSNEQERQRQQTISAAFSTLAASLPDNLDSKHKKSSKMYTVETAVKYIRRLDQMLGYRDGNGNWLGGLDHRSSRYSSGRLAPYNRHTCIGPEQHRTLPDNFLYPEQVAGILSCSQNKENKSPMPLNFPLHPDMHTTGMHQGDIFSSTFKTVKCFQSQFNAISVHHSTPVTEPNVHDLQATHQITLSALDLLPMDQTPVLPTPVATPNSLGGHVLGVLAASTDRCTNVDSFQSSSGYASLLQAEVFSPERVELSLEDLVSQDQSSLRPRRLSFSAVMKMMSIKRSEQQMGQRLQSTGTEPLVSSYLAFLPLP